MVRASSDVRMPFVTRTLTSGSAESLVSPLLGVVLAAARISVGWCVADPSPCASATEKAINITGRITTKGLDMVQYLQKIKSTGAPTARNMKAWAIGPGESR